ncbi:MAG: DUF998 domain-containing protein [Candidatus Thermoplasmatota archaeon]
MRRWRNVLACLGLGAIAAFVFALVALHIADGRDTPSHMSEFANSRFGLLWALAVYTVVVGGAMVVWALKPFLQGCPSKWIGMGMLAMAGVAGILIAAFPTDETYVSSFSGRVHNDAALSTFALLGAAMVVLYPALRASPGMRSFARVSVLLGVLVTASWVTYLVTTLARIHVYGPTQRILVALIVTWFILLGLRVRAAARPPGRLRTIVLSTPAPPIIAVAMPRRAPRTSGAAVRGKRLKPRAVKRPVSG